MGKLIDLDERRRLSQVIKSQREEEMTGLNSDTPSDSKIQKGFKERPKAPPKEERKDMMALTLRAFQFHEEAPWSMLPPDKHEGGTILTYNASPWFQAPLTFKPGYDVGLRPNEYGRYAIVDIDEATLAQVEEVKQFLNNLKTDKKGYTGQTFFEYQHKITNRRHLIFFVTADIPYSRMAFIEKTLQELLSCPNIELFPKLNRTIRFTPASHMYEYVSGPTEPVFIQATSLSKALNIDVTGTSLNEDQKIHGIIHRFENELRGHGVPEQDMHEALFQYVRDIAKTPDKHRHHRVNDANKVLDYLSNSKPKLSAKRLKQIDSAYNPYTNKGIVKHGTRHREQLSHIRMAISKGWTLDQALNHWHGALEKSNNQTAWKHAKREYKDAWRRSTKYRKGISYDKTLPREEMRKASLTIIKEANRNNALIFTDIYGLAVTQETLELERGLHNAIRLLSYLDTDANGSIHIPVSLWRKAMSEKSYLRVQKILDKAGILLRLDSEGYHYNTVQPGRGQCYKYKSNLKLPATNSYHATLHPYFSTVVTTNQFPTVFFMSECEMMKKKGLLWVRPRSDLDLPWTSIGPARRTIISNTLNDGGLASI